MQQKGKNQFSVWHDKKRDYFVCRVYYIDEDNAKRTKSFISDTAFGAQERAKKWLDLYEESLNGPGSNPLIESWIKEWLTVYVKASVRPSTYQKYIGCLKPIREKFGLIRLNELKPAQLQRFFNNQLKDGGNTGHGLSPITVRNQRRYFSSCIDMAVNLGLLEKNPVKLTKPPKIAKKSMQPLTYEEAKLVLAQAHQNYMDALKGDDIGKIMSEADLYIGVFIALETGMRLGEIMGLVWSDIQEKRYLTVQRSKSDVPGQNITTTKTGVGRNILINQALYKALCEHKAIQTNYKKTIGNLYEDHKRVIGGLYGNGYYNRHYSSRKFQKLLKQVGITREIRFHDLRHTNATIMLLRGVNVKVVQERLGHSSIDVTMDTYSHLMLTDQSGAITVLQGLCAPIKKE